MSTVQCLLTFGSSVWLLAKPKVEAATKRLSNFCVCVSFRHLDENNLLDALPLEQWYGTCFAGVLTNQSLIRIWDKICGGSRKIVVFVFVTLFSWIWRTARLSSATQVPEIITIIDNVSINRAFFCHLPTL